MKKKIIANLLMLPILIVISIDLIFGYAMLESHIQNPLLILEPCMLPLLASLVMWRKGAKAYTENKDRGIKLMFPGWIIVGLPSFFMVFYTFYTPFFTVCAGRGMFEIVFASICFLSIDAVIISIMTGIMLMFHYGLRAYICNHAPKGEPCLV